MHQRELCACQITKLFGLGQRYLDWNEQSKSVKVLKYICGGLLLSGGVYLIHTAR